MTCRLGVLVSGSGSNLQALLDACAADDFPAEVAVVISNVPGAFALERAKKAGVAAEVVDHKGFGGRAQFEQALLDRLAAHRVDAVCLAGFMRILGAGFLEKFPGRVLNIHPSLLPAFPGMHGPKQALQHGVKVAGCTVHFVDPGLDSGPIILQAAVPVLPDDTEEALAKRILAEEHRIYPEAVRLLCSGRLKVDGRMVKVIPPSPRMGEGPGVRGQHSKKSQQGPHPDPLPSWEREEVVLVSACLLGEPCRYDGRSSESPRVLRTLGNKSIVPICPEAASGLGIPRPAVQLCGGVGKEVLAGEAQARVRDTGKDVTAHFLHGARLAVEAAKRYGATVAILKERSPSCGTHRVWVDGALTEGEGVTARALKDAGVTVLSDEEVEST